ANSATSALMMRQTNPALRREIHIYFKGFAECVKPARRRFLRDGACILKVNRPPVQKSALSARTGREDSGRAILAGLLRELASPALECGVGLLEPLIIARIGYRFGRHRSREDYRYSRLPRMHCFKAQAGGPIRRLGWEALHVRQRDDSDRLAGDLCASAKPRHVDQLLIVLLILDSQ